MHFHLGQLWVRGGPEWSVQLRLRWCTHATVRLDSVSADSVRCGLPPREDTCETDLAAHQPQSSCAAAATMAEMAAVRRQWGGNHVQTSQAGQVQRAHVRDCRSKPAQQRLRRRMRRCARQALDVQLLKFVSAARIGWVAPSSCVEDAVQLMLQRGRQACKATKRGLRPRARAQCYALYSAATKRPAACVAAARCVHALAQCLLDRRTAK
jgi:hypothetical protein